MFYLQINVAVQHDTLVYNSIQRKASGENRAFSPLALFRRTYQPVYTNALWSLK